MAIHWFHCCRLQAHYVWHQLATSLAYHYVQASQDDALQIIQADIEFFILQTLIASVL